MEKDSKKTISETISSERGQSHELRKPLLETIGQYFKSSVLSFYGSFDHWQAGINSEDVSIIKDILFSLGKSSRLLLIIHSPGGDPLAAERIIKICSESSTEPFEVLVPDKAKSAATMICLGAGKIYMTPTSELGPIDVQIPWNNHLLPAHIVIKSYDDLMEKGQKIPANQRLEPILQQLQSYQDAEIENLRLLRDLSKEIAAKVLSAGMMKDVPTDDYTLLLKQFLNPEELKTHSRPIFYSDIKMIDSAGHIKVECLGSDLPISDTLHEYHQRVMSCMEANKLRKICETSAQQFCVPM